MYAINGIFSLLLSLSRSISQFLILEQELQEKVGYTRQKKTVNFIGLKLKNTHREKKKNMSPSMLINIVVICTQSITVSYKSAGKTSLFIK